MLKHKINRTLHLLSKGKLFDQYKLHNSHQREEKILPEVEIETIISPGTKAQLEQTVSADGNVSLEELKTIALLTAHFKPQTIFEIGTFDGRTTLNMAVNSPGNSKIYTLDLPKEKIYNTALRIKTGDMKFIDKKISGARFIGTPYEKKITQIYADSATFDYSPYHNKMDMIFIDGSHSYEYVISDTENCLKLLRNGKGVIIWHDYGWHEVVKALNNYYRTNPFFKNIKHIRNTTIAALVKT